MDVEQQWVEERDDADTRRALSEHFLKIAVAERVPFRIVDPDEKAAFLGFIEDSKELDAMRDRLRTDRDKIRQLIEAHEKIRADYIDESNLIEGNRIGIIISQLKAKLKDIGGYLGE